MRDDSKSGGEVPADDHREQRELQAEIEALRNAIARYADLQLIMDKSGRITHCTVGAIELGMTPEDLIGRWYPVAIPDHALETWERALSQVRRTGDVTTVEYAASLASGERILAARLLPYGAQGVMAIVRDVTTQRKHEQRLKHEAMHDPLTGLPNRVYFNQSLQGAMARVRRRQVYKFAVLFIDLDGFKIVNDTLGHLVGDQLLYSIAGRIKEQLRPGDVVARYGGDEFTVLLDDLGSFEHAARVTSRIQRALSSEYEIDDNEIFVTASIGVVLGSSSYHSAEEILREADRAMYRAKRDRSSYSIASVPS